MRTALIILAIIAAFLVLIGAFNADVKVGVDLLAGSVDVSLFWLTVAIAAGLAVAGVAGWTMGRVAGGEHRRKLEGELGATYRRLRECEARLPRPVEQQVALPAVTVEQRPETVTVERPAEDVTVEQSSEPATVEQSPEPATVEQAPEDVTVEQPAPDEPEPGG